LPLARSVAVGCFPGFTGSFEVEISIRSPVRVNVPVSGFVKIGVVLIEIGDAAGEQHRAINQESCCADETEFGHVSCRSEGPSVRIVQLGSKRAAAGDEDLAGVE